jgi:hypothetical protein
MNARNGCAHRGMGAEFRIECRSFKAFQKNTLRAFVSLRIDPPGLTVNDCCLHEKNGRRWLAFPARPYQRDGDTQWQPIVAVEDREVLKQFQSAGLAAIARYLNQGGER